MRIGAWNVRTLMDRAGSDRPQRRTALVGRELGRYGIQRTALSETRFADVGRSKKLMLDTPSSGVEAKVKRGVKQGLALPLKQNLLVSFQDCQKASMTA